MKRLTLLAALALTVLAAGASLPRADAGICPNDVFCYQEAKCDFMCGGPGHGGCLGTCCVCI